MEIYTFAVVFNYMPKSKENHLTSMLNASILIWSEI